MTVDIHRLVDAASGLLDPHVYTDPDVFELEMERVFGRCWLFLAHDSQIPNEQDYLTTYMGRDPIIVVRQKDGSVKAFLSRHYFPCDGMVEQSHLFIRGVILAI